MKVLKANKPQRLVTFVAYSPNRMPLRGADGKVDVASPEVVEKAAHSFVENGSRTGLFHKPGGENAFQVLESSIYRNPRPWKIVAVNGEQVTVRKGDWVVTCKLSEPAWEAFQKGLLGGVSVQGTASRRPARPETLARQRSN